MNDVRRCDDHGFVAAEHCPECDVAGDGGTGGASDGDSCELVVRADRRRRLSKFLSGVLRHFPGDVGIDLDEQGWAERAAVVDAADRTYDWVDREAVDAVVATDPKGRFEADGDRLRAAYGHSVDVDLAAGDGPVPDVLYHGTDPRNLDAIRAEGLRPMTRQLVHLSGTVADAREVGARHADDPVVLAVDAAGMRADGHRIARRGSSVYTTEHVPPAYVRERE